MKKSITTIAAALIMITSFSSFATTNSTSVIPLESIHILKTYVEASSLGTVDMNNTLFAEDFKYQNLANGDIFTKKEYVKFLDKNKGVQYDCQTEYEILDENSQVCVAKTIMKFKNFTRIDYVTLNHTVDGWEINKVVTSYQK